MSSKFLFLFLSTFLLVQGSLGNPLPEETTTPEKLNLKLLVYVLGQFSEIADVTLDTGRKLFKDVIAEASSMENKNEQVTAKIEEYSKFVEKIEKNIDWEGELFQKFEIMGQFMDILEKANVAEIEKPSSTDKLFYDLLVKHGLIRLSEQHKEKFVTFAKDFSETADKMLDSKTVEEWPQKIKIQDWLKDFKAEEDNEKKFAMFSKLFKILE